jgi:hypothetical protein
VFEHVVRADEVERRVGEGNAIVGVEDVDASSR